MGLARQLVTEGKDVVMLDSDRDRIEQAVSRLDCMGVVGNGTDPDKLVEAGIENAEAFITLTDSDEINLISCGLVKTLYPGVRTVAAIRSLSYAGATGLREGFLGIDHIVNPAAETGRSINTLIDQGVNPNILNFFNSTLLLYNMHVGPSSRFAGSKVMELRTELKTEFILAAICNDAGLRIPSGETIIEQGDTLSIVANEHEAYEILKAVGDVEKVPKRMVFVGASKITRALLTDMRPSMRSRVTLIDKDGETCEEFSERFREILVIHSDITDEDIMQEEQLTGCDLLVALTDNDELNVITASYAKRVGITRSIALIKQNNNYVRMAWFLDIDVVISTTDTTVESLLRYLRSTNVSSVHTLFDGQLEIIEYVIPDTSPLIGKALKEIDMRTKALIAGITERDGTSHIPSGNSTIEADSTLLVVLKPEHTGFIETLFGRAR
ncbi:MAG: Trk system potassium transporter TrkA [Spirochaetales bacterium]|nr:Trk system potassium transporter TrkA [Spirochaetales bacterium]